MIVPIPPKTSELREHTRLIAGLSHSTILADFDFETFSPAGYTWNIKKKSYDAPRGSNTKGLISVGVVAYTEHPDAEVLSCAYNLKDGKGARLWTPDLPAPIDLFEHLAEGGLLEAWNSFFEYNVWNTICVRKYGWPCLPISQLRCAMAKARAFSLPGSLSSVGDIMKVNITKDKDGKRLLNKFSIPRKPTKNDPSRRICPQDDLNDAKRLYEYNLRDIEAEAEISSKIPDLNEFEQTFWLLDQQINARGVCIDTKAIEDCITVIEQAYIEYNGELRSLTHGAVESASQVARLITWLASQGIQTISLDDEHIMALLQCNDLTPEIRRVLTIRSFIGSAAVKKLYAMINRSSKKGRLHDLFVYHSARTGRFAGTGVQPQNFPNSGNFVHLCECGRHSGKSFKTCPWCGQTLSETLKEWNPKAIEDALYTLESRDLKCVEYFWGEAVSIISGCLRSMFIASPGCDLICSDYSAIEAVVLAALSGEDWQLEVFRTHGKIYEMTGARITGEPFENIHKLHPARKLGKIASLASGYGGWLGAWKQFGADSFMSDDEIKQAILAWRAASPSIVAMWGDQPNWRQSEYVGLEGTAVLAIMNPGVEFNYRGITYRLHRGVLYCRLLSGRYLVYHNPRLSFDKERDKYRIEFDGYNTNPLQGAIGWVTMQTYGGKLTENVVQATARDLLAYAMINLESQNYSIVLHVHDEIVIEVKEGQGSVAEVERIMSTMPAWATNWPVKAVGGWRAKRYGK